MKNIKRKGFTLVELLIVIVVIGILSAMMMLSSTEAVTSARASNIVSNLRNFKTAALAMYVDKLDEAGNLQSGLYGKGTSMDVVVKYMNNSSQSGTADADLTKYGITKNDGNWFVYYEFADANADRIKDKLDGRAKSVGLHWGTSAGAISTDEGASPTVFNNQQYVGMWVVKP